MEDNLVRYNINTIVENPGREVEEGISRRDYGYQEIPVEIDPVTLVTLGTSLLGFGSTFLNFLGQARAFKEQKKIQEQQAKIVKEIEKMRTQRAMVMIAGGIAIVSILVGGIVVIRILTKK